MSAEHESSLGSYVPRVLTSDEALDALRRKRQPAEGVLFAMYSSYLGGIVTDPTFMTIPIDDHMCHRGHAVFDTTSVSDGKMYNATRHVERLLRSAVAAKITHAFNKEYILSCVRAAVRAANQPTASVRMWISSGPGDFNIVPSAHSEATFYCVVSTCFALPHEPLHEVSIPTDVVGMKATPIACMKNVCYLPNALLCMTARERGGYYGLWFDPTSRLVKEGPINSVVAVIRGVVVSPPPADILSSCTVRRVFEVAMQFVGGIHGAEYRPITLDELYEADELFFCGADTHFFPIAQLDSRTIGGTAADGDSGVPFYDNPKSVFCGVTSFILKESRGAQPLMGDAGGFDIETVLQIQKE